MYCLVRGERKFLLISGTCNTLNSNLLPPKRLTGTVGVAKKTRAVTGKVLEAKRDVNKMKTIGVRISHQKQIGRSSEFAAP